MIMTENSSDIYVGSTIQTLKRRLVKHESDYRTGNRYCSSQEILKQGGYKIILIKNFPCSSENELWREEGKFQRDLVCVNNNIAGRTKKEYYSDNREMINAKMKEHYINNREVKLAYQAEYSIKNQVVINAKKKAYYIKNREVVLSKGKEKFSCECGGKYTTRDKTKHFKTKKHQNHIKIIT